MSRNYFNEKKLCDCGNPAVRVKNNGYVCAHCDALEAAATARENRKKKSGTEEEKAHGAMGRDWTLDNAPICGASLKLIGF